jgi:hypothetical protein
MRSVLFPRRHSIGISHFRSHIWLSVRPFPLRTPHTGTFWRSRSDSIRYRVHLQHGAPGHDRHLQCRLDGFNYLQNRVHRPGMPFPGVCERPKCQLQLQVRQHNRDYVWPNGLLHRKQRFELAHLRKRDHGEFWGLHKWIGPLRRILPDIRSLQPAQLTGCVPPFLLSSHGASEGDSSVQGPAVTLRPLRVAP